MYAKLPKICILAIVIVPVLLFDYANGFTELQQQQQQHLHSTTVPAVAALGADEITASAALTVDAASAVRRQTTTATTTTTLASSNAPATITSYIDAAVAENVQRATSVQNDEVATTAQAAIATTITTSEVAAVSELTSGNTYSTEVPTTNWESKSRAATTRATEAATATVPASTADVADRASNGGNEAQTQIKNVEQQMLKAQHDEVIAADVANEDDDDVAKEFPTKLPSIAKKNSNKLVTINEQEIATTTTATSTKSTYTPMQQPEQQEQPQLTQAERATKHAPSMHKEIHVERKLENGLYRIKLAEIVTDEFSSGLTGEQPNAQDSNNNDRNNDADAATLNIVDLYPMKMEDFKPIIRDSNAKLLKERTIFVSGDNAAAPDKGQRQNHLPNEVEVNGFNTDCNNRNKLHTVNQAATTISATTPEQIRPPIRYDENTLKRIDRDKINYFTGRLLAEQDRFVKELAQKFGLKDLDTAANATTTVKAELTIDDANKKHTKMETTVREEPKTTTATIATQITTTNTPKADAEDALSIPLRPNYSVNHVTHAGFGAGAIGAISGVVVGHDFIDRRVKKSFDFPMHRVASDAITMPHIDFANTKFNTDTTSNSNGNTPRQATSFTANNNGAGIGAATHPEFSTTKFYNSKELYNEMLQQHNKQQQMALAKANFVTTRPHTASSKGVGMAGIVGIVSAASKFASVHNKNEQKLQSFATHKDRDVTSERYAKAAGTATLATNVATTDETTAAQKVTLKPATSITLTTTATTTTTDTTNYLTTTTKSSATQAAAPLDSSTTAKTQAKKYTKELKRAKLLLKSIFPTNNHNTRNVATASSTTTASTTTAQPTTALKTVTTNKNKVLTAAMTTTSAQAMSAKPLRNSEDTAAAPAASTLTSAFTAYATTLADKPASAVYSTTAATMATTSTATATSVAAAAAAASTTTSASTASATAATTLAAGITLNAQQRHATNPTKSTSKPIARPRILSRLQEKINSLECEIQNVPKDSHLWRGNETHELLLPIVSPETCKSIEDCSTPLVISWEGEAEIQSGDILIVEINDILLHPNDKNNTNSAHNTQVYQVTRSGHEHCDVTEGILLDITPLVVDGRKLVTLYDKDLTEGVNLLIVVSELWGSQCVRLKVTTKTDNCGENADCSGKGVCYSNPAMEEYECQCCSGFAGPHCEEIDACTPSPCTNNGICVDLSQGHEGNSYQCLCPYGYIGKNCQYESDPCNPTECMNGGSCVGNSTHFRCDCTPGYTGPLCQHSLNECESSPCVHGICVDQEDGFRCFCQPGFAGELCNFEYNECESNPCQNNGECIDHIGSYECRCTKGYSGTRCQIKVDFCANKPCPEGHRCIDHGNDFSCECPGGRNGPDCNQMPRTQCNVNPCTHGGTCWSSGDSFYCACRPGYTGTMCEDEFVVETVVSSSEFMVDDTSTRNFNDKSFGSSVVLKSPIELHNAYFAAGVLAAAIFIVAIVVTICHCKVNQTYRKFSTRSTTFFPILGFGRRPKSQGKINKHWLSGKGLGSGNPLRSSTSSTSLSRSHLPATNGNQYTNGTGSTSLHNSQLHERPFQRHLAMNLENDMYYTVDFSENSQHSPLIQ